MTKQDLVDHIRDLSEHMLTVANEMQYYAGVHEELYDKGTELLGASHIAKTWADELEGEGQEGENMRIKGIYAEAVSENDV